MLAEFEADFHRWCDLHSWYKHLPLEGADFTLLIQQGEQPRNGIHPEVIDTSSNHLWFVHADKDSSGPRVRLGPFMTTQLTRPHGFAIILQRAGDTFDRWLSKNHPDLMELFTEWNSTGRTTRGHPFITALYRVENQKYWAAVLATQGWPF